MIRGQEREQKLLVDSIIELGGIAEEAMVMLKSSIEDNRKDNGKNLSDYAAEIKSRARECERKALRIILIHHPVAKDLRLITSAIRMSSDIERIGDNAGDISEILPFIRNREIINEAGLLPMCSAVSDMLSKAIDALVEFSQEKAEAVIAYDDTVDSLFMNAKNAVIDLIRRSDSDADEAPDVLMAAKYFERMGDHAASFASYVGWCISGDDDWLRKNGMV